MAGFSFLLDLQPFEGIEAVVDYRISGTVYPDGDKSFDTIEVLGRGAGLSWDGWRQINHFHPLFPAAKSYLETKDADEQAKLAIRQALEDEPAPAPTYLIYRHAAE